jgi:hypothetical protein
MSDLNKRLREDQLPPCPECEGEMEFVDGMEVNDRRIACTRCPDMDPRELHQGNASTAMIPTASRDPSSSVPTV